MFVSSTAAEAETSRRQPNFFPYWFHGLVVGQDLCEECRFQPVWTEYSPAAHSPASWGFYSFTAPQSSHGASSVQGNLD